MKQWNLIITGLMVLLFGCKSVDVSTKSNITEDVEKNQQSKGTGFVITLETGKHHNHPTFAIWLETTDGEFIQTKNYLQFSAL